VQWTRGRAREAWVRSRWHVPELRYFWWGACATLPNAAVYSTNVTVVPDGKLGYLTIWPAGRPQPVVSTLNSVDGRVKADAAIVPAGANGAVSIYVTDTTNVIAIQRILRAQ